MLQIMLDLIKLSSKYCSVPLQSYYVHKMPAIGNMVHFDQLYSPFWILRSSMYICDSLLFYTWFLCLGLFLIVDTELQSCSYRDVDQVMDHMISVMKNTDQLEVLVQNCWSLVLSCMHRPVQSKSLSWWGEVGNSLIFQHSPSRGGSLRPQVWNRSEQQLFYLIALTRIRSQDLWLWYHIELHALTSLIQKLKLMGRGMLVQLLVLFHGLIHNC